MIVRMSEAAVRPGREADFERLVVDAVAGFPDSHDGLLSHEVLTADGGATLIYLSRWRDEEALVAYAGPDWRDAPVVLPGEEEYLVAPLRSSHYEVVARYDG